MGIINRYISFLVLLLMLLVSHLSNAQELPQVHKINGKKYYLHVVEAGNTLYGVSKKYEISVDEIKAENPLVSSEGLKINQTLLIPVNKENKKDLVQVEESAAESFLTHEVGAKETLYSISKKYDITLEDILKANPELEDQGLKAGSSIKIPYKSIEVKNEQVVEAAQFDSLKGHLVEKGETIYSLSKKYGVSQDDIFLANNKLPYGLKVGMMLRIPGTKAEPIKKSPDLLETLDLTNDSAASPKVPASLKRVYIALLLPLNAVEPDSLNSLTYQIPGSSRIPLSFLRGFQYGLDSLVMKTDSLSVQVKVYDLARDTAVARTLLESEEFEDVNIVVGPLFTDQFQFVADLLNEKGIPIICPIPKPSKILFKRKNAIKIVPSETMQLQSLAELLASEYADSNVVIVNSRKMEDQVNLTFLKNKLAKAKNIPDTAIETGIKEMTLWDINYETLSMRMKDSGSYVFVVPSKNNVFISQFISEMYSLQFRAEGKYHITIIGMEDWTKIEDNLDIQQLQKLNVTLMLPSYMDKNDYRVKAFFKNYYLDKGYEPNDYTLQGYDLAAYLVNSWQYDPEAWFLDPANSLYQGLLSNYSFKRVMEDSGVEAAGLKLYRYQDYKMKEVAKWPLQKTK